MSWWCEVLAQAREGLDKPAKSQPMTLTDAWSAGYYCYPPELAGIKIWGWSLMLDGRTVAHMTADDRTFAEERKLAERMVFAYNQEFGA